MKILDKFFIWLANSLGKNSCIILFIIIAFAPLIYQRPQTILELQNFISQTVIQLIALAVLAKLSKIEGAKQQQLLQETHDATMNQLSAGNEMRKRILLDTKLLRISSTEMIKMHKDLTKLCNEINMQAKSNGDKY